MGLFDVDLSKIYKPSYGSFDPLIGDVIYEVQKSLQYAPQITTTTTTTYAPQVSQIYAPTISYAGGTTQGAGVAQQPAWSLEVVPTVTGATQEPTLTGETGGGGMMPLMIMVIAVAVVGGLFLTKK
jgi:hypothetical protein